MKIVGTIFLLVTFSALSGQEEIYFLKGMAHYELGNFETCILNLDKAINQNYKLKEALFTRGKANYGLKNMKGAELDFNQAAAQKSVEALLWLAKVFALDNNPKQSTDYLGKYLKASDAYDKFKVLKLDEFKRIHYSEEWQILVETNWLSNIDETISDAIYLQKQNNYNGGIKLINGAILDFGPKPKLLLARADLYVAMENYELACLDYIKLTGIYPNNTVFIERLANCYFLNKEYDKAVTYYRNLIEQKPEKFQAYKALARIEILVNQTNEAINTINTYLNFFENDTSAIFLAAECRYELQQYRESIIKLNKLLQSYAPHANWFLLRGLCYQKTNTLKYAAEDLSMCLDLEPNNPTANFELGNTHYKLGNKLKACYFWERAERNGEMQAIELILENCQ